MPVARGDASRVPSRPTMRARARLFPLWWWQADMHVNIDYMAPNGAPDNDRKMKESSWLTGQAFIESLRYYPKGNRALENNDCEATYSGCTHSARQVGGRAAHHHHAMRHAARCGAVPAVPAVRARHRSGHSAPTLCSVALVERTLTHRVPSADGRRLRSTLRPTCACGWASPPPTRIGATSNARASGSRRNAPR